MERFDHHCRVLNCCIGGGPQGNYRQFIAMLYLLVIWLCVALYNVVAFLFSNINSPGFFAGLSVAALFLTYTLYGDTLLVFQQTILTMCNQTAYEFHHAIMNNRPHDTPHDTGF